MSNPEVIRSAQFVSLDTHPANNALVLTYEVVADIVELPGGRQLGRRTKRHQLQVSISALDRLSADPAKVLNLADLGAQLVRQCPLLARARSDDIQLHLLYLVNRRQAQLARAACPPPADRPGSSLTSSASARRRTARSRRPSTGSGHSQQRWSSELKSSDLYAGAMAREGADLHQELHERLLELLEGELEGLADAHQLAPEASQLDSYLEGLYGGREEQLAAMSCVGRLLADDRHLNQFASHRLLLCAMLRCLRDSHQLRDLQLHQWILYCLLRLTFYADVAERALSAGADQSAELVRLALELLEQQARLAAGADQQAESGGFSLDKHGLSSQALVLLLGNLLRLQADRKLAPGGQLLLGQPALSSSLVGLLHLASKQLVRDIRLMNKLERPIALIGSLLSLLTSLSVHKEFVQQLRHLWATKRDQKSAPWLPSSPAESLVSLLASLQLSRPGSGAPSASELGVLVSDSRALHELYQLELSLIRLLGNLLSDVHLRNRLVRRNLLKCTLRNLVVFLASRRSAGSSSLEAFQRSSVLLQPLRCLYQLTCVQQVRQELYRSRIVVKCLLEFLISATLDLKLSLEELRREADESSARRARSLGERASLDEQPITLDEPNASQYIMAVWMNLSASQQAPIYSSQEDGDLLELLREYLNLFALNTSSFVHDYCSGASIVGDLSTDEIHKATYLQAKLVRNMSQFMRLSADETASCAHWLDQLEGATRELLQLTGARGSQQLIPLTVETLNVVANLLTASASSPAAGHTLEPERVGVLLERLLQLLDAAELANSADDLMLASVSFMGALARHREICAALSGPLCWRCLEAAECLLAARASDGELVLSCLFALRQLLSHSAFVRSIAGAGGPGERHTLRQLLDRLAELLLSGQQPLGRLAAELLQLLNELDADEQSGVRSRRFASYNGKWLSAIQQARGSLVADLLDGHSDDDDLDRSQLAQLRAVSAAGQSVDSELDGRDAASDLDEEAIEEEEDDDDDSFGAPDMNVIDANSMIKHLSSRR